MASLLWPMCKNRRKVSLAPISITIDTQGAPMSARNILVINCGSSSIKFALVNEAQATFPLQGLAECIGSPEAVIHFESAAGKESVKVPNADHQAALAQILPRVEDAAGGHLDGIGHRVVHGGGKLFASSPLPDETLGGIEANFHLAPLQNPATLRGIHAAVNIIHAVAQEIGNAAWQASVD